jgi:2-methylcitrate dehydratase PrpD
MNAGRKGLIIKELIHTIIETNIEAFSRENIEDAKNRMIDIVGCAIGGARASGNSILTDLVKEWGGKEEASVWVYGIKVPAQNAALVNCVMCRSYDYEVTGLGGHSPGTIDITALTLGEQIGADGKEVISAAILGGDLAVRISNTQGFDPKHDFDGAGTINGLCATAVAGRLKGLDKDQMLNAFGIVVNLLGGSFQCITDGVHCFKLHQGVSARNAVFAVDMARKGFTGIKDPLFSPQGYFPMYCRDYHPEYLTAELGRIFYAKGAHKVFPSCYGNHCTIECGLEIVRQHDINVEDIAEITVGVTKEFYEGHLNQPFNIDDPLQRSLFSLPYAIANALLRKDAKLEHYTDEFVKNPKVAQLTGKVKVVPIAPPEAFGAAEVKVKMNDGREFYARSDRPLGSANRPLTREEIKDKFLANVDFSKTISRKKAKKVLTMLENLEKIDNVSEITKLLVSQTKE